LQRQRHGCGESASPTPRSLFGRGRARAMCEGLFNSADRPRKKLITKLNNLFYAFTSYLMSNAPKTMELRFPCASGSSHLPSILTSVAAASFWLVVALIIIDRRPFKAAVYFIFYIFCRSICRPKQWDGVPPCAPPPTRLRSNIPPSASAIYRVDCWLSSSIGGHLRPRLCLPLYFLMRLGLALQSTEPATARAHRMTRACFRTIGSGGAKI
jgi:hypothetical protein